MKSGVFESNLFWLRSFMAPTLRRKFGPNISNTSFRRTVDAFLESIKLMLSLIGGVHRRRRVSDTKIYINRNPCPSSLLQNVYFTYHIS
jgi:hypothetical protein